MHMLTDVERAISDGHFDRANIQAERIRSRLEVLSQLRTLESRLEQDEVLQLIRNAREHIVQKRDVEARELLEQINEIPSEEQSSEEALKATSRNFRKVAKEAVISANQFSKESTDSASKFRMLLLGFSGFYNVTQREKFWMARPLLSLFLLMGLLTVGIHTLYVKDGKTFGSRPLTDYLGLVIWGFSADLASRSLSSLKRVQN